MEKKESEPKYPTPAVTESTAKEIDNVFKNKEADSIDKVEAALFISGKFLNSEDLTRLTDLNPMMLKEILNRLKKKYSSGVLRLINKGNL